MNPSHYIENGYVFKIIEKIEPEESGQISELSSSQQELLMRHSFISGEGDSLTIGSIDADYVLLDFWFAGCLPCLKAIPELNLLAEKYADDGLKIIGINCVDLDIRESLITKLSDKGIKFPLFFGPRIVTQSLNLTSFPTYFLITHNREIKPVQGNIEDVKKLLMELFNE